MSNLFHVQYPIFVLPYIPALYIGIALVYLGAGFVFAFLPFFFVIKKWQPVTWWKAMCASIATAFLYFIIIEWKVNDAVGIWLERYVQNADYFTQYIDLVYAVGLLVSILLSLSPFFWIHVIYRKYTWGRFSVALILSVILLASSAFFWFWFFVTGLQHAFMQLD